MQVCVVRRCLVGGEDGPHVFFDGADMVCRLVDSGVIDTPGSCSRQQTGRHAMRISGPGTRVRENARPPPFTVPRMRSFNNQITGRFGRPVHPAIAWS